MSAILKIQNLTKEYEQFLLDDISLELEEGYIMGLVGPNGAGKTTLIKLILGLLRRDSGDISIFGRDITEHSVAVKQHIGFVLEGSDWYDGFRIQEMVRTIAPFYTDWDSDVFDSYLRTFGMTRDLRLGTLSKGMKMKFSLAVALSHHARLIVMDEPTSGLDPIIREEFLDILQQIIKEGDRSILFSSHITSDIERIADYVTFINAGRIILSESCEKISDTYWIIRGPLEYLDADTARCFEGIRSRERSFTALSRHPELIEQEFGSYVSKGKLVMEKATIDEIMLHTIKGENYVQSGI